MKLSDADIRRLCQPHGGIIDRPPYYRIYTEVPLIEPFSEAVAGSDTISSGISSAGYDLRLAPEVWVLKNTHCEVIDPRRFKDADYCDRMFDKIVREDYIDIPPHSYILGRAFEKVSMPNNLCAIIGGKSTYARCGLIVNCTLVEPMWSGFLTLEISNSSPCPVRVFPMQGIAQIQFEILSSTPLQTYANKRDGQPGVYQDQTGVTPARVKQG